MTILKAITSALVLLGLLSVVGFAHSEEAQVQLEEIYVLKESVFSSRFAGAHVESFDLSADGKTLAVEFQTWQKTGLGSMWITLWDVEGDRLMTSKRLEGPGREVGTYPQYVRDVRFSPDGKSVFVLTGPRLVVLNVPKLDFLYAIEAPSLGGSQKFIYKYSLATTANRLGLLYVYNRFHSASHEIHILDAENGQPLQKWEFAGQGSNIALSPDGNRVAVISNPESWLAQVQVHERNLFIFDTKNGNLIRSLNTGYNAGEVQFIGEGSQIVTIALDQGTGYPVRIWDVSSSQVVEELEYEKYGIRGNISSSRGGRRLGATTFWENPEDYRKDRTVIRGFSRFLLWDVPSAKPIYISADLEDGMPWHIPRFLIRLSSDGKRFAVGGERIVVYKIEENSWAASEN